MPYAQPSPSKGRRHVLLIEDDAPIRELVTLHLSLDGYEITAVNDGVRALELARATAFDAVILDLMLPGLDGMSLCRAVRAQGANTSTPILMLTARDTESDKVLGLESGADDYLTKPFGVRELVARVAALLRRGIHATTSDQRSVARRLERGDLVLDPERREAVVRGTRVELTKQEST